LKADTAEKIPRGMVQVQVWAWECERCGHQWMPREKDVEPRVCPKCKSPYWNKPRRVRKETVTPE